MTDLKELLGDVAEQARVYDVSRPVVRVARRRQRMQWIAPVAAAAAVALAAAAGWAVWPNGGAPKPAATRTAPPDLVTNLDWLPAQVREPTELPPVLPTDKAVGPASVAYASCAANGCYGYLVLPDGTQYRLAEARQQKDKVLSVSLSPDGRWLAQVVPGAVVMRDLAGTKTHRVPGYINVFEWSPDSRWVQLMPRDSTQHGSHLDPTHTIGVFDLRNSKLITAEVPVFAPGPLLNTGELVFGDRPRNGDVPAPARVRVLALDPRSGKTRTLLDVDIADSLREGELVSSFDVDLTQDGSGVMTRTVEWLERPDGTKVGMSDDILKVTWGGAVTRYAVPRGRDGGKPWVGEEWGLLGQYGKDLLLMHSNDADTELQALDTKTGRLRTVCQPPRGITEMFLTRGM